MGSDYAYHMEKWESAQERGVKPSVPPANRALKRPNELFDLLYFITNSTDSKTGILSALMISSDSSFQIGVQLGKNDFHAIQFCI